LEVAPLKYFVFLEQVGRPWRRLEVWASDTARVLRHRIMASHNANTALRSDGVQASLSITSTGAMPVTRGRFQILWRGAALDGDGSSNSHALDGIDSNSTHRRCQSPAGHDTFTFGGSRNGYLGMHDPGAFHWLDEDANHAAGMSRSASSRTLSQLGVSPGATLELVPLPVVLHVRVPSLGDPQRSVNDKELNGGASINRLQHSLNAQAYAPWPTSVVHDSTRYGPRGNTSSLEAVRVHPDHGTPRDVFSALQSSLPPHWALDVDNRCWLEDVAGQRLPFGEPLPDRVIVEALSAQSANHVQLAELAANARSALAHSGRAQLCLAMEPTTSLASDDVGMHALRSSAQVQYAPAGVPNSPKKKETPDHELAAAVSSAVRDAFRNERGEQDQSEEHAPLGAQYGHDRSTSRRTGYNRRAMHVSYRPATRKRLPALDQYRDEEVDEVKEGEGASAAEAEMATFMARIGLEAFCPKLLELGVGSMYELVRAKDALLTAAGFYPSQLAAFHRAIGRTSIDLRHFNDVSDDENSSETSQWEDVQPTRPLNPTAKSRTPPSLAREPARRDYRPKPRASKADDSLVADDESRKSSNRARRRPSSHGSARSSPTNNDTRVLEDESSAQKQAKEEADAAEASQKRAMAARAALEAEMQAEVAQRTAAAQAAAAEAEASARARTAAALAAAVEAEAAARTAAARGAAEHAEAMAKARTEAAMAALEQAEANARAANAEAKARLESANAAASEDIAPNVGNPATLETLTARNNAVAANDMKSTADLPKDTLKATTSQSGVASTALEASTPHTALAVNKANATVDSQDDKMLNNSSSENVKASSEPVLQAFGGGSPSRWKQTVKEVVRLETDIKNAAEALLIGAETGDENVAPPSSHQHLSDIALEALSKSRLANNSAPQSPSNSPLTSRKVQAQVSLSLDGKEKSDKSAVSSPGTSTTSVVLKRRESIGEAMRRKADEALDAKLLKQKARAEMKLFIAKKKGEVELSKVGTEIYLLLDLNSCVSLTCVHFLLYLSIKTNGQHDKAHASRMEQALLSTKYVPYSSSENASMSMSNSKELPSDPREAIAILQQEVQRAIVRLELNPVKFFNMANKGKAKFLGKPEIIS